MLLPDVTSESVFLISQPLRLVLGPISDMLMISVSQETGHAAAACSGHLNTVSKARAMELGGVLLIQCPAHAGAPAR